MAWSLALLLALFPAIHANDRYILDQDVRLTPSGGITSVRPAVSHLQCALLCTRDVTCAAANYDPVEGCELFTSPLLTTAPDAGSSAIIGLLKVQVPGLLAFWPLNQRYGGRDLVTPVSEIHLHGVTYTDTLGIWRSPPVLFAGTSASYGQIIDSEHLRLPGSFSWMASVYRSHDHQAPLFNGDLHVTPLYAAHIWLWSNGRIYVAMNFASCPNLPRFTSTLTLPYSQWATVAVAYDALNDRITVWVNGEQEQVQLGACGEDMLTSNTISIAKRCTDAADTRYLNGHLTCMSLYDTVMSYEDMYAATMPLCLA